MRQGIQLRFHFPPWKRGRKNVRRKRLRRYYYRPRNRRGRRILQSVLILTAAAALLLSLGVVVRSVRTERLNRQILEMYTAAGNTQEPESVFATRTAASPTPELSYMGLPDGTSIETVKEAGIFHKTSGNRLSEMMTLLQTNPDTVGWLSINGIVTLPVVYRNNEYYLNHDFTGQRNSSGTLFLDQGSPLDARTQNLLIHGHNMNDGSMFGLLTHYQYLETLIQHPLITFSTLWEKETYAIFAVLTVSPKTFDFYSHPVFSGAGAFDAYIESIRDRSIYYVPVNVNSDDALMTLSTCVGDDRLLIMGRKMRNGETQSGLASAVKKSIRTAKN